MEAYRRATQPRAALFAKMSVAADHQRLKRFVALGNIKGVALAFPAPRPSVSPRR
jgi:hypothetical protein